MPDIHGYTGPAATILESGRSIAPGTPLADGDLTTAEVDFFTEQGWLTDLAAEAAFADAQASEGKETLAGEELKARAAELNIEGRSTMSADELRAAVADAEAASAENGATA